MANYPSPPNNRLAYDIDGSVGIQTLGTVTSLLPAGTLTHWNDELDDGSYPGSIASADSPAFFGMIFPQAVDISGYYVNGYRDYAFTGDAIQTSVDTTNLVDGTWVDHGAVPLDNGTSLVRHVNPTYRTSITPVTWLGVKGIRIEGTSSSRIWTIVDWQIYGRPSAPQYLQIWDHALDQEVTSAYFDWGDIPESSNDVRTFRVHNYSAQTAKNIVLSFNALTPGTPDSTTWHYLSLDGVNYFSSINIGDLGPGFTSGVLYAQRVTPANAQLGLGAVRVIATATFV